MRSTAVANTAIRTTGMRATFTDERLRFNTLAAFESLGTMDTYDASDDGLLRICAYNGSVYTESAGSLPPAGTAWTARSTITLGSRPAVFGTTVFYQKANGDVVYGPVGSTVTAFNCAQPVAIAPVSPTKFYTFKFITDHIEIGVYNAGYTLLTDLPFTNAAPVCDAVTFNGYDYLYFGDGYRARWMKVMGTWFSDVKFIVPLDIVDDASMFRLSSASVVNGKVIVSGILKRSYGLSMHVFTIGPEEFTMGRDLVIRPNIALEYGKLHLSGNDIYFVGPNIRFKSDAIKLVGVDNAVRKYQTTTIVSAQISQPVGDAAVLTLELPSSTSHAAVRTGSRVVFEGMLNGSYFKLGEFAVDAISKPREEAGTSLQIVARSWSMKAISQWESDASYDYWSQTKLSVNPNSLADYLRVTGQFEDVDTSLSITKLNDEGILYCSANASRNAMTRARFVKRAGTFQGRMGVGVNYYRESLYEAAARLSKKSEDVQENEYGNNGIFAVWGLDENGDGFGGVGLYEVVDNVWTKLANTGLMISDGQKFWLGLQHHEGVITVWYKLDGGWAMLKILSYKYTGKVLWKKDEQGRGALYLKAMTPNSQCYPFGDEDDYIPVVDNSTFPTSELTYGVYVDDEQISYSSKSQNVTVPNLSYRYGNQIAISADPGTKVINFANARITSRIIQGVKLSAGTFYVTAVKVWVKKVGFPEDGMEVMLNTWPPAVAGDNDWVYAPLGTNREKVLIPSENISKNGGWVVARFPKTKIVDNDWIVFQREKDASHPSSSTFYTSFLTTANTGVDTWYFDEDEELAPPNPPNSWFNTGGQDGNHLGWLNVTGSIAAVWTAYSGNMPFKLYGTTYQPGEEFLIHVNHDAALSATANYYVGQALTVTAGPGAGQTYKITRYEHGTETCIFAVDRTPDEDLDETSILAVVPVLNVSARGLNSTVRSAHGATTCGVYRPGPYVQCDRAEFYSGEMDLSLYDFANIIARKAGVLNTSSNMLVDGSYTTTPVVNRRNFMVQFPFGTDNIQIEGRRFNTNSVMVEVRPDHARYHVNSILKDAWYYDVSIPSGVDITVSYFDLFVSVWASGRLMACFPIDPTDDSANDGIRVLSGTTKIYKIREACARVDNFILDAGRKGAQLFSDLIGEKRFFIQDDENGDLRIFAKRNEVNTLGTPYAMTVTDTHTDSDSNLVTRLRLEGSDVSEQYDADLMIEHGNLYHQSNMMEINSPADAAAYTAIMLDDIGSRMIAKTYSGAIYPKLEAGDTFYVQTPEGTSKVLVDSVDIMLDPSAFDMSISGRIPRSEL